MKTYIVLLILLSFIIFFYCYYNDDVIFQTFTNTSTRIVNYKSSCGRYPELLQKVMEERNMNKGDINSEDFDLYIPCSYNSCERDVLAFENKETGKKLFFIDGCDWIASKLALWELLKDEYGREATKYMPQTYLLEKEKDLEEFKKHYDENLKIRSDHMYVLKNYAQRQEGIKLTRSKDEIVNGLKDGWFLVQDYMYDPFIIDRRKINFRYYLLITCYQGKIEAYVHKNGFLYYTPDYYEQYDMKTDRHITTGYIDRKVYEVNPLTLDDFRNHLEKTIGRGSSQLWDDNLLKLMKGVMNAISKKICKNPKLSNQFRFQLFGCDVAPDSKLEAKLMEINKGPDLGAKDERDKQVKIEVQRDLFKIIDPTPEETIENTRFVKINF